MKFIKNCIDDFIEGFQTMFNPQILGCFVGIFLLTALLILAICLLSLGVHTWNL